MDKKVLNAFKTAATKIETARKRVKLIEEQIYQLREEKAEQEKEERAEIAKIYNVLDKHQFDFKNLVIDNVLFQDDGEGILNIEIIDFTI